MKERPEADDIQMTVVDWNERTFFEYKIKEK